MDEMDSPGGSGWNDPPSLSYKLHSGVHSRRNILNKRVSYLNHSHLTSDSPGNNSNITSSPPQTLPPRKEVSDKPPLISSSGAGAENVYKTKDDTSLEADSKLTEDFDVVSHLREIVATLDEDQSCCNQISKKIDSLQKCIDGATLSPKVLSRTRQLAKYLGEKKYKEAWEEHIGLMVDHITEVRSWMPGVKKIISILLTNENAS